MTDAITLLTSDHEMVKGLFQRVQGSSSPDETTVNEIVKQLSIHDAIEKQYLYPFVREHVQGGDGYADHSIKEHDEVAETLLAIDKAEAGSHEQAQLLARLIPSVLEHVQEEEGQIFPAMRSAATEADLEELGTKLGTAKETAPTRPHPMAPSEGLGTKVAGAMSAPLDKAKDALQGRG
jgi:hemerythrin superfamily protein